MQSQRNREYQRQRYANLSHEEKQRRHQATNFNRRRRQTSQFGVACFPSSSNSTGVENFNVDDQLLNSNIQLSELHVLQEPRACRYCGAKLFQFEPPSFCCYKGQVMLAPPNVPDQLYDLFTSSRDDSKEFRQKIRALNSIFAFTSFGAHIDKNLSNAKQGIYTFRSQGQIYHSLPPISKISDVPCYFQLYIYDTESEVSNRMHYVEDANISEGLVQKLISILSENPYSKFFRSLSNRGALDNLNIIIRSDVGVDQRVYNAPTISQVAAIWIENHNSSRFLERDILLTSHSGCYRKIKHFYGCYDPLQYPILFPYGEAGWHQNIPRISHSYRGHGRLHIEASRTFTTEEDLLDQEENELKKTSRQSVSCRQYYSYKLQIRQNDRSILLHAGRLLHQYVVDMYVKIETSRLDFFRLNQHTIRADLYKGLVDSVISGETSSHNVGQRIILPSSFIGGPRDMRRRYLDAMALVQRYGKPDLFITMTCNPDWPEIQHELQPGETSQDRPDLTSRIFRAKVQDLKDQLLKKSIFGSVAAHVYVIEFQKRGLPHAHFLIILKMAFKLTTPEQFDRIVCAELPDPSKYIMLHQLVVTHMMHGPCGALNKNNVCMKKGLCKNKYPRSFSMQTFIGDDSYPIYRRRNDGLQVKVRNSFLDNRWVVPYNPYLLSRYNCHINVEVCSGIKAIKYVYKYIYKGHDKISVSFSRGNDDQQFDELQHYQDARWVSAPEAFWRIFEFDLNEMYPSVCNLQLHLEDHHTIYFKDNQNLNDVVANPVKKKTMLTEFFELNKFDPEARQYLYREIPEKFVWNRVTKIWTRRKRYDQIGRINTTTPTDGERYYLRMLLNHTYGPTSYEDLLKANGVICTTFKEAAEKNGLLDSETYVSDCLHDAVSYQMPHALRQLFALILVYCDPSNVTNLWNDFYMDLSDDYQSNNQISSDECLFRTLSDINIILARMGKSINDFNLPSLSTVQCHLDTNDVIAPSSEILDELNIITPTEDINILQNLNSEQRLAYEEIITCVTQNKSVMFFIDGPGGTGKTYLYRAILATLRSLGHIALATATSGVAASLLPGGRTAHSRFKIPIHSTETSLCTISKQSGLAHLLKKSSIIIWDEAPMVKRTAIESLDRSLQDIMDNHSYFGGKVIVFGGDFRQVLPVVRRATRNETINYSLVKSYLWPHMRIFTLHLNMRAKQDPSFCDFILKIGNGDAEEFEDGLVHIPDEIIIKCSSSDNSEDILINKIFSSLHENFIYSDYIMERAILSTKNEYVDKLNDKLIKLFPGEAKMFYSFDTVSGDDYNLYQIEFLNSLTPNGLPPHRLILKEFCPIMLLRNLDPSNGLCNGTRMICKSFKENVIVAKISSGQFSGKIVMIPRIPLAPTDDDSLPFKFQRKQFPIRLSFAMTINKSQGQTIPNVGIYLPHHVFSHGQLYVALSRGISMNQTSVLIIPDKHSRLEGSYTKNVVYKEIFSAGN